MCVRDCPGDLMLLKPGTRKAMIRDNRECWDCAACVKVCCGNWRHRLKKRP